MALENSALGSPEQLKDPDYTPPLSAAVPLGIQHVLAMFVSNVTPAIIICGAAGFGFGSKSADFPQMIYMIQMSMLFAGVATLLQTIGFGPVGARLPVVQGTSFAFLPVMIPLVAGKGVDAIAVLMGGIIVGGGFHGNHFIANHASEGGGAIRGRCWDGAADARGGGDARRAATGPPPAERDRGHAHPAQRGRGDPHSP